MKFYFLVETPGGPTRNLSDVSQDDLLNTPGLFAIQVDTPEEATKHKIPEGSLVFACDPNKLLDMFPLMGQLCGGLALVEDNTGGTYTSEQFIAIAYTNPLYTAQ